MIDISPICPRPLTTKWENKDILDPDNDDVPLGGTWTKIDNASHVILRPIATDLI